MKTNKLKQKRLHYAIISVVSIAMILIGIGIWAYVVYFPNSTSSSHQAVAHTVGFDADSYLESESSVFAYSTKTELDRFSFSTRLEKPGDSYDALINIVNNDTVTHYITAIELASLGRHADALEFTVEIDDTYYTGKAKDLQIMLPTGGQETRKQMFIKVNYRKDAQDLGAINLDLFVKLAF